MHDLISVLWSFVKRDGGRPRSQWEGPARDAERPPRVRRSGARGRALLTHGGGRDGEYDGHFLPPLAGLVGVVVLAVASASDAAASSSALILRIDGPSSARR